MTQGPAGSRGGVDGVVVVDKPAGWTSHDVVGKLRGVYGQRRVGHAGTLDPDATGVLLVGLGAATRLLRYLQAAGKTYRGRVVFGIATDTLDADGRVTERRPMQVSRVEAVEAARAFVGEIEQVPPMVSAVKIGGVRLHELARRGEEIERPRRSVFVERLDVGVIELSEHGDGYPQASIEVACGSGVYVRTLAADLGAALGGCAHLAALCRMSIGSFTVSAARSIEAIEADPGGAVLSPAEGVRDLGRVVVGPDDVTALRHGKISPAGTFLELAAPPGQAIGVVDEAGCLVAVVERDPRGDRPVVVMPEPVRA